MTIFYNDDRDYSEVIELWVRNFISTMDEDEYLSPGNDSGIAPAGVKIIFDGFGDLDNGEEYVEAGDKELKSFAVFVHKNSLHEEFPEHEITPWALIHRPKEECCIYVWYDERQDSVEVIPFEDNNSTELDVNFVTDLIFAIDKRQQS